ncbi:unnamed protein product [Calypogeia fissa]
MSDSSTSGDCNLRQDVSTMAEGEEDEFHDSDYEVMFDTLPPLDVLGDNVKMFEGNNGPCLDTVGNSSVQGSNGLHTDMTSTAAVPGSGQCGIVDSRSSLDHAPKHPVVHSAVSNGADMYLLNGAGHSQGNNNGGHSSFSNGVGHVQVNTGSNLDPVGNFSIDSNGLHTAMTRSAVVPGSGQRLPGVVDTRSSVAHATKHPVVHTPTFSNGAPSYLPNGVGHSLGNNNGAHTSFSNGDLRHFQGNTGPSLYHAENFSVQRPNGWLAGMAIISVIAPDLGQKRGKILGVANSERPLLPKYLGVHSSVQGSMVGEWNNGGRQDREDWIAHKTRKMMKNRDSAAKSRARKVAYQMQVEMEKAKLMAENESLRKQIESLTMFNSQIERPLRRTRSSPW